MGRWGDGEMGELREQFTNDKQPTTNNK